MQSFKNWGGGGCGKTVAFNQGQVVSLHYAKAKEMKG